MISQLNDTNNSGSNMNKFSSKDLQLQKKHLCFLWLREQLEAIGVRVNFKYELAFHVLCVYLYVCMYVYMYVRMYISRSVGSPIFINIYHSVHIYIYHNKIYVRLKCSFGLTKRFFFFFFLLLSKFSFRLLSTFILIQKF